MRKWLVMGAVALLGGLIVGCAMVSIALQHNPQNEFFDERAGGLQVGSVLSIFIPWMVIVMAGIFILELLMIRVSRLFWPRKASRTERDAA